MKTENSPYLIERRQWLRGAGGAAFGLSFSDMAGVTELMAAEGAKIPEMEAFNRFPRMVHEYYVRKVSWVEMRGLLAKSELKTKADAEAYVKEVQKKIKTAFSPFPRKKSPLKPRITGTVERGTYKIEKLIFESRPGFLVTANLYIPEGRKTPMPAVVGTCGHSSNGKAAGAYQSYAQGLAKQGYVVLIYDPIGQGERLQYLDDNLKPLSRGGPGNMRRRGTSSSWSAIFSVAGELGTGFGPWIIC